MFLYPTVVIIVLYSFVNLFCHGYSYHAYKNIYHGVVNKNLNKLIMRHKEGVTMDMPVVSVMSLWNISLLILGMDHYISWRELYYFFLI